MYKFIEKLLHIYFIISRPLTLGARAIIHDKSTNSIYLIKHTYQQGWSLPGGGVEVGASGLFALQRDMAAFFASMQRQERRKGGPVSRCSADTHKLIRYQRNGIARLSRERGADRFNRDEWSVDSNALPYLEDSEGIAFCSIVNRFSYATHLIAVLKVNEFQIKNKLQSNPLLYGRGDYIDV